MFGIKSEKLEFQSKRLYSLEEYLEIEPQLAGNYEFFDGRVGKLNEPDFFIESIVSFEKKLSDKLDNRNYKVFSNYTSKKKKIWISSENCLMYPSLIVADNKLNNCFDRQDIIDNPLMIIEVSTFYSMAPLNKKPYDQKYLSDRTGRFWSYQKIPSLAEYVLIIDNGQTMVETYNRLDKSNWKYQVFSESGNALIHFESLNIKLPITDLYL